MTSDNQLDFSVPDSKLFKCTETRACFDLETSSSQLMWLVSRKFSCEQRKSATASLFIDSCSSLIVTKASFKKGKNNDMEKKIQRSLKKGKNEISVKTRHGDDNDNLMI